MDDRVAKVLQLASTLTAEKLLDIGCGDGSMSLALKNALGAKEVFGIETSAKGAQEAERKSIVSYEMDVDEGSLPFEDSSIDAIYPGEIVEHLYDPDHLVDEIFRVLRAGGVAIIDTPNLAWWADRLSLLLGYQPQTTENQSKIWKRGKAVYVLDPRGRGTPASVDAKGVQAVAAAAWVQDQGVHRRRREGDDAISASRTPWGGVPRDQQVLVQIPFVGSIHDSNGR